jgi:hypothetical protein
MGIFFILRSSFFYAEKQTATCWWQQKLTNIRFCLLYKEERWRALFLEGGREILNIVISFGQIRYCKEQLSTVKLFLVSSSQIQ